MRTLGEAGKVASQESSPSLMTAICFSASFPEKVNAGFVAGLCGKPDGERTAGHGISSPGLDSSELWTSDGNVWVTEEATPKIIPLVSGQNRGLSSLCD